MRIVVCGIKSENFSSDEKGDWMPKPKSEGPWNCKKCGIEIGGHNQYLHDGMCDDCFFMKYFPEDEKARRKRLVTLENGSQIDPICMETKDIENALGLKEYIETIEGADDKAYAEAFLEFLEKTAVKNMAALGIYEGEVTKQFEIPFDEMKENIRLIAEDRGIFYDEDREKRFLRLFREAPFSFRERRKPQPFLTLR